MDKIDELKKVARLGAIAICGNGYMGIEEGEINLISYKGIQIRLVRRNKTMFYKWDNVKEIRGENYE